MKYTLIKKQLEAYKENEKGFKYVEIPLKNQNPFIFFFPLHLLEGEWKKTRFIIFMGILKNVSVYHSLAQKPLSYERKNGEMHHIIPKGFIGAKPQDPLGLLLNTPINVINISKTEHRNIHSYIGGNDTIFARRYYKEVISKNNNLQVCFSAWINLLNKFSPETRIGDVVLQRKFTDNPRSRFSATTEYFSYEKEN